MNTLLKVGAPTSSQYIIAGTVCILVMKYYVRMFGKKNLIAKKRNSKPKNCFDYFSLKRPSTSVENYLMQNPLSLDPLSVYI